MYAQRFEDGPRFRPVSLGVALAINGGVVAALLFSAPGLIPNRKAPPEAINTIDVLPPHPQPTPEPSARTTASRAAERPDTTTATALPPVDPVWVDPTPYRPELPPGPTAGGTPAVEPLPPVFVGAAIDPRYAGDFQPDYPDAARDAGREGVAKLRVRIGIDGRVKQVERLAGDDVFWRAASRHALARWRFTPATRGGVPEESWRVMSVRFQLS